MVASVRQQRAPLLLGVIALRAAALRQGLEQVGADSAEELAAADFIPGFAPQLPRARGPSTASRVPIGVGGHLGGRGGTPALPTRGQRARMPVMQWGGLPNFIDGIQNSMKAGTLIATWQMEAQVAKSVAVRNNDDKARRFMEDTENSLELLDKKLADGNLRGNLFAVTTGTGSRKKEWEGAKAVAYAAKRTLVLSDNSTKATLAALLEKQGLGGGGEAYPQTVDVIGIAASPGTDGRAAMEELLRWTSDWASIYGWAVTAAPKDDQFQEYYESLGFELVDKRALLMVYTGYKPVDGGLLDGQKLHFTELDLETPDTARRRTSQ
mmetsp:Transcript_5276/g.14930  ORF Transcript_5276/g.14930 Transcript_5276/m.14930 type:complete len:324 (-) Transcript_5276:85-1056(-)